MNKTVNSGVRKNNYERGLKNGSKVYCGQDLRELVGMRIVEVHSDDNDANVILWAEEETGVWQFILMILASMVNI